MQEIHKVIFKLNVGKCSIDNHEVLSLIVTFRKDLNVKPESIDLMCKSWAREHVHADWEILEMR